MYETFLIFVNAAFLFSPSTDKKYEIQLKIQVEIKVRIPSNGINQQVNKLKHRKKADE